MIFPLTDPQRAAVEREGQDVCVVAGPGSGKTRVLVERYAWLVRERGIPPSRILAITFTIKAANEIRRRLSGMFTGELAAEIQAAPVHTIDGFCTRLLKRHAISAGLDPEFAQLDEWSATAELRAAVGGALDALWTAKPAAFRALFEAWAATDPVESLACVYEAQRYTLDAPRPVPVPPPLEPLIGELRPVVNALRGEGKWYANYGTAVERALAAASVREFLIAFRPVGLGARTKAIGEVVKPIQEQIPYRILECFSAERATLSALLDDIAAKYSARKRARAALDFADLEAHAIRLLDRHPSIRERASNEFDAILMDELQDTNPLQWRLVNLLRRPQRFFAVGDLNQSIFGFRHAAPEHFAAYQREVEAAGGAIDRLEANYRSRPGVLESVTSLLSGKRGVTAHRLEPQPGDFPPLDGPEVEVIEFSGDDMDAGRRLEARGIARRIQELVSRGTPYSRMAILVRKKAVTAELENAFDDFAVPWRKGDGGAFFTEQVVLDLTAWLRVLANPLDDIALFHVMRSPLCGMSDEEILRGRPADSASLFAGAPAPLRQFIRAQRLRQAELSPVRLLMEAMDRVDYEGPLNGRERAGVRKFLSLVDGWSSQMPCPLAAVVEEIDRLREFTDEPGAPPEDAGDSVVLMTMHKAKGLEFPVVFLPSLHSEGGGRSPDLTWSLRYGLGARWRLGDDSPRPDAIFEAWAADAGARDDDEINRLLYVAMTRAEERLVLSFVATKQKPRSSSWPAMLRGWGRPIVPVTEMAQPVGSVPLAVEGRKIELLLDPLPLTGQYDSTVSATAVALFRHCPRRYFLDRYIGVRPAPPVHESEEEEEEEEEDAADRADELNASDFGLLVHDMLAGTKPREDHAEAAALARRFDESTLGLRLAAAREVAREFDFLTPVGDIVLRGRIDAWFADADGVAIVDYKTDDVEADDVEERAGTYGLQLQLYALALEAAIRRPVTEAWLSFVRPGVEFAVDLKDRRAAVAAVEELIAAQNRMKFELREGRHCFRCPHYRGACPAVVSVSVPSPARTSS